MKAALGLEPGIVRVEPYSEHWPAAFDEERQELGRALGDMAAEIQHIGSTAVPGLSAKPILDIAVAATGRADTETIRKRLMEIGYEFAVDAGSEGGLIFFRRGGGLVRTHHVHVVGIDDIQWRNYLRFRNRLREDGELRQAYARLKGVLAVQYERDRDAYTKAKTAFIQRAIGGA